MLCLCFNFEFHLWIWVDIISVLYYAKTVRRVPVQQLHFDGCEIIKVNILMFYHNT